MKLEEFIKSILRTRVLIVHPIRPGYKDPSAESKKYWVLGSDEDIQGLTDWVNAIWPERQRMFLI